MQVEQLGASDSSDDRDGDVPLTPNQQMLYVIFISQVFCMLLVFKCAKQTVKF